MIGSINEASESSQLPVTITVCISVNTHCCKRYISLCYSFLALQDHDITIPDGHLSNYKKKKKKKEKKKKKKKLIICVKRKTDDGVLEERGKESIKIKEGRKF